MSGVNEIRSAFLSFFAKNGHAVLPSSSLVPHNDPSLMFTNAGMVPFKNVFTGAESASVPRAATAQKCVRAGGKHNDLDNVGYTARHHTFFEMLGNFSFGDYFKEQAIALAWELITREFALPKERLLVTVFSEDEEAARLWRKIAGLPESRILRIATSDNFWAMGDTGPCGPCSEIFYDHGEHIFGGPPGSPDQDGDRFIEIWNLVFMQYEQVSKEQRIPLPRPSIDTGMGLERIAAVLQGTHDNYETDLFRALITFIETLTGITARGKESASHRVIADHLRAAGFLIADGVLPSNEGRGYVLRRILRRAMRHAQLLGAKEPLLWRLTPALLREMGQAYPELMRAEALLSETLKLEETRFRKTLERGLAILEEEAAKLPASGTLAGDVAFTLYDTYGFPLDLTEDALRVRGLGVDHAGFAAAMERQKAQARASWSGSGDSITETLWFSLRDKYGATEFLGYETLKAEGRILALIKDGGEVVQLNAGETGTMLVNQTPFYAESGGQVGDSGTALGSGVRLAVTDTQKKLGTLFVHHVTVQEGTLAPGSSVELQVDAERRQAIRANHSATHLLHEALRLTLGEHVAQKGSMVGPERLRFDFSHPVPMRSDEMVKVEDIANRILLQNTPITTRLMAVDEAIASGARALFGEKYGEEVRVVAMGDASSGKAFSIELCGGTHVARTGEIGLVTVVSEGGVASGVRRLEALTGEAARHYLNGRARRLVDIASLLKAPVDEAPERVTLLIEERRKLERELTDTRRKAAMNDGGREVVEEINGIALMARILSGIGVKDLKSLADEARKHLGSGIVALVSVEEGKAGIVVSLTPDLIPRFDAVSLVRLGALALGGTGGGGRPDMAQAGGPNGAQAQTALHAIRQAITGP
jgi:alanyl-tRNA synthetase